MKLPKPVVIDFETDKIVGRPNYPPKPVGVSIKPFGKKAVYYAFGHPTENNCTIEQATKALKAVWDSPDGLLFQNGKFDVDVAEVHLGLPLPAWDKIHDTMFLLFLDDPHQKELGLKPSAERLLNMPAEEQDAVGEWLMKHQPVEGVKISRSKNSEHYFGAYISKAPGNLVGKYANGDTIRTEALFKLLYKKTVDRGMLEAYNRERRLMPCLLDMERQGLPVNLTQLRKDVKLYNDWLEKLNWWVIKTIKASTSINLDSGDQLIQALIEAGKADADLMPKTATGKISTAKESLLLGVTDKVLLAVLKYRTQLNTCLHTFMMPWLAVAEQSKGLIFTNWNQVKAPKGADTAGTRTGRLSSTPNFQNIPNVFKPGFQHEEPDAKKKRLLPKLPVALKGLPPLPQIRGYVVPFKGEVLLDRDYSQQEPRLLGHFDGGSLADKYNENPWIDLHDYAKDELAKAGKFYERKPVKNTNLGLIYGMGSALLAIRNDMTVKEAGDLKKAILGLYPGLKDMYKDMKFRAKNNIPIRTWGSREYYCEEAKLVKGRIREFDYKMINVLIQGSAADCTKEAIIRFYEAKKVVEEKYNVTIKLLLQVHDELVISIKKSLIKIGMNVLQTSMEELEGLDVPMLSEGTISFTNWAEMKNYDKKGVLVYNAK